jgi:ketosteroid isomerase-like protein
MDVFISTRRDGTAARRFFERAIGMTKVRPAEVVTDRAPVYPLVLEELLPVQILRRGHHELAAEELVRSAFDAFAKGDVDTLRESMEQDAVWHVPGRRTRIPEHGRPGGGQRPRRLPGRARRPIPSMTSVMIMLVSLGRSSLAMDKRKTNQEATIMADRPAGTLGVTSTSARGLGARAAALACGVLLLAACGGTPDRPSAQATTSSRPRTAAEICARQVGYWAAEVLKPATTTTYGDYQKMGLAGVHYQLVLEISKEAKRLRKTATQEQTLAFIAQEAKRRCAEATTTCTTTASYNGFPSC